MSNFTHLTTKISIPFLIAVLSACGGGGGGSSTNNNTESSDIEIESVLPNAFTEGVDRAPLIRAQFSGELFFPSVDSTSFQLLYENEPVSGSISFFDTNGIDFSVDEDLNLLSNYTGRVTTGVTDISGLPLANSFEWSFVTRDGIWRDQEGVAEGAIDNPAVIADANGSTWVFYSRDNLFSMQNDFFARRLLADNSFGSSQLVSNGVDDENVGGKPQLSVLSNGDLLAVWQDLGADATSIWYNRFDNNSESWGESQRVIPGDNNNIVALDNNTNPKIVNNNAGDIFILFEQEDSLSMATDLMVTAYDVANDQWLEERQVADDLDIGSGEGEPSIAIDSAGNAMLLFYQNNRVVTRYYNASTEIWENVVLIDDVSAEETQPGTQLVVDSQNNFTAVWPQEDAVLGLSFIWFSRYTYGEGWSNAEVITGSVQAFNPQLVIDRDDNMTLIWQQDGVSSVDNLLSSRFNTLDSNWSFPELLEEGDQDVSQPSLTIDRSGNVMAIWQQNRSGTFIDNNLNVFINPPSIWVRRFDNTGAGVWRSPQVISAVGGAVGEPSIDNNTSGEIMALWMQEIEGEPTIQSRRFD